MENLETILFQLQLVDRHTQHQEKTVLIEDAKLVLSAFHTVEEYDTHALDMIGTLFVIVGNWEKQHENFDDAMKCFDNARICFTACSNKGGVAKAKASIANIHFSQNNSHLAIILLLEAKQEFEELQMEKEIATSLGNIAANYVRISDFTTAIGYWRKALHIHEQINDINGLARTYSNLGSMYTYLENYDEAITSHLQAINLYQSTNNTKELRKPFSCLGSVYYFTGNYELALEYYKKSLSIAQELGIKTEHANSYINIGNVYIKLNEFEQGIELITKAISILENTDSLQNLGVAYGDLADAYSSTEYSRYNSVHAEELYKNAIGVLESIHDKKNSLIYHKKLAELYEATNQWKDVVVHLKKHYELQREIQSAEVMNKANLLTYERKNAEREKQLAVERAKHEATEQLLYNVLPPAVAQKIMAGDTVIAERLEYVSVLFADIVNFTVLSQTIQPEVLVKALDTLFTEFDTLAEQYGLEKIKTIGDAYMCVAGAPSKRDDDAYVISKMANDMMQAVSLTNAFGNDITVQLRIGIHVGDVVAGVIGKKKFAYDLWGDAVNTASRMESYGEPNKIHVTEEFAQRLQHQLNEVNSTEFTIMHRGNFDVKGKGTMTTYFVEGMWKKKS